MVAEFDSAAVATLAVACIGGGYALGIWLDKLFALVAKQDRSYFGDVCGVIGGLWGLVLFVIAMGAKLSE